MEIRELKTWVVNVPFTDPFQSSFDRRTGTTRTVVRLETDSGVVGWGETFRGDQTAALIERHRHLVIGRDPFQLDDLTAAFRMTPFFYGYVGYAALAGIEMACWDIIGKQLGVPLASLLGGAGKRSVPVTGLITRALAGPAAASTIPARLAEAAAELVRTHGFGVVKVKGSSDPDADVAIVTAIREGLPDVGLRLDPNAAWSLTDSIRAARRLLGLELEYLEDPCPGLEGMARVRQAVPIALCTNMCVVRLEDVAPAVRMGAVDVIHGDVHKWGGIGAVRRLAALCDAFGLGMNLHSGGELGISTACHLIVASVTREIGYAIDSMYYLLEDDILERRHVLGDGRMTPPVGPGLGVSVDTSKLEHAAARHRSEGDLVL